MLNSLGHGDRVECSGERMPKRTNKKQEVIALLRHVVAAGAWTVRESVLFPHPLTGTPREVDIVAEQESGGIIARLLFEVKGEKDPLDVESVEGIVAKYRDLVSGQLFIVSWSGFTKEAHRIGSAKGAVLVKVKQEEGQRQLYADQVTLTPRWFDLIVDVPGQGSTRKHAPSALALFNAEGAELPGGTPVLWLGALELLRQGADESELTRRILEETHNHPERTDLKSFRVELPIGEVFVRHDKTGQLQLIQAVAVSGDLSWNQVPLELALKSFGDLLFGHGEAELSGRFMRAVAALDDEGNIVGASMRIYGNRVDPTQ
jgi:hypothetical protein